MLDHIRTVALNRRGVLRAAVVAVAFGGVINSGLSLMANEMPAEPATKPERLVVRTWGGPWRTTYGESAAASFTARTGIPVEFDVTDFNELQVKIAQSVSAGSRPPVDLVLTIESMAFAAQVQGLSVPLDPYMIESRADLSSLAMPAEATSYVNVAAYSQPVVYDPKAVTLADGISWDELLDPKYEGTLFVTNTFPSLLFPFARTMGLDPAKDDLTPVFDKIARIKANIAAAGDEEEFIAGIEAGEVRLGVTLVGTAMEVEGLKWVVPKEGAVVSAESMYVPAGLPEDVTYWAQVFISEVLTAENQSKIAAGIAETPINLKATVPDFMKGDPAFPVTEAEIAKYGIVVPVEVEARNKDRWQAAYSAAIQR
ncbi:MAG TPA: PotD/PotF family extracellular solute-binding protein [Albidovulum sp.]|uniref:ABC transporter substrate-binding protein n=1 Tax=Albidovulum sp. TaxID=1872424 RepID=UPI002C615F5A|nr:PotD/PotF family extracellular solute-binding protein [Albidovulum sp.]